MWNGSIKLLSRDTRSQDKDGFLHTDMLYTESIPADFKDVTRNDEILAAQKGYTANQNIEIMSCNYHGEKCLVDESDHTLYDVKRIFRKDKSMRVTLTCERRQYGAV